MTHKITKILAYILDGTFTILSYIAVILSNIVIWVAMIPILIVFYIIELFVIIENNIEKHLHKTKSK